MFRVVAERLRARHLILQHALGRHTLLRMRERMAGASHVYTRSLSRVGWMAEVREFTPDQTPGPSLVTVRKRARMSAHSAYTYVCLSLTLFYACAREGGGAVTHV